MDLTLQTTYTLYLPFQHTKLLHGLILVCVCIQSYKWVLSIQCPSFSESCVISFFVKPSQSIAATIMEMLNSSLNLQTTETRHASIDGISISSECLLKVAENSFQYFSRRIWIWGVIITTLYQLMPQSWYQQTAQSSVNKLLLILWHNRLP